MCVCLAMSELVIVLLHSLTFMLHNMVILFLSFFFSRVCVVKNKASPKKECGLSQGKNKIKQWFLRKSLS